MSASSSRVQAVIKQIAMTVCFQLVLICVLNTAGVLAAAGSAQLPPPSVFGERSTAVDSAILTGNWEKLEQVIAVAKSATGGEKPCDLDPLRRFLIGHSALATGRNSLAVENFYCACDTMNSVSTSRWRDWTKMFVLRFPFAAAAHYLHGDALARTNDLAAAKSEFDKAIELDSMHFLSLNARGVVERLLFEHDSTLIDYDRGSVNDLYAGSRFAPRFADTWANLGLIGLRDESYFSVAVEKFDRALEADSAFWLALNGKAVALGATGRYWEFTRCLELLEKSAPATPFVASNRNGQGPSNRPGERSRGGFTASMKVGFLAPTPYGLLNAQARVDWTQRGGIFIYVKDGENLAVMKDGRPRLAGSWFTLNYLPAGDAKATK